MSIKIMGDLDDIPPWLWGSTLIALGISLTIIHLYHLTLEEETFAMVIGVFLPIVISLIVIWVGVQLFRDPQLQKIGP
ncbi:MAG: hypothetical protein ACQEQJ_01140 [Halobacteriota archaeon]